MITAGRLAGRERAFGPGLLGFGETVSRQHTHVARTQFAAQLPKFQAQAVADFFARQHDGFQILAVRALLGGLM